MTDFLYNAGTNGFIVTPFDLLSTELNALATANSVVSSVGGSSGVFNQTHFGSALLAEIWFTAGGAFTPTGAYLSGWFIRSSDGGTNFEKFGNNIVQPRAPDFTIPLFTAAYASGDRSWANGTLVTLPPGSTKVMLYSVAGVTLPATGNHLVCAPVGVKY